MLERSRSRSRSRSRTRTKKFPPVLPGNLFFPWTRQNRSRQFCPGIFFFVIDPCHRSDQDRHLHTCCRLTLIILRLTPKGQSLCWVECRQEREDHLEASKRIRRAHHPLPYENLCGQQNAGSTPTPAKKIQKAKKSTTGHVAAKEQAIQEAEARIANRMSRNVQIEAQQPPAQIEPLQAFAQIEAQQPLPLPHDGDFNLGKCRNQQSCYHKK